MKIYLAARWDRAEEMRHVRDVLCSLEHEVTSHWIDVGTHRNETYPSPDELNSDPQRYQRFARRDLSDIVEADWVILFNEGECSPGRNIEFGYAEGLKKRLVLIGPRTSVFHTLSWIAHYESWQEFLARDRLLYQLSEEV